MALGSRMSTLHPHPRSSFDAKRHPKKPISLTTWIFLALALGIGTGLFIGEYANNLKFIGDIYVGLMQMTVLPYVVFSLIGNIGRLSVREVGLLATSGLKIFLGLWAIAALTVLLLSQAFPELATGQYFSSAMVDPPPKLNWLNLFVPSNPFRSLADNSVPAVVVFCILFGVAMIGFEEKKSLLDHVGLITRTLHRVNGYVVKLTPVGVFGICAHAAGTMSFSEFERLQAYYLTFGASVLILTFVILPLLVTVFTPFTYRQVIFASKDALLTAFVTGSVFPVIPLLIDGVNGLYAQHFRTDAKHADFPEFILPLAYPFPDSGNVIDLIFIPFAAWFLGDALGFGDELFMVGAGFFLLFGKVFLTIPFLLNSFHIPQDMFQLFLAAGVLAARVGDILSSMHYLVFTVLTTAAMTGLLKVRWRRLFWAIGVSLVVIVPTVIGIHYALASMGTDEHGGETTLDRRDLLAEPIHTTLVSQAAPNPVALKPGQNRLERIKQRGMLRVGYRPDNLPYTYFNQEGKLVGHDIDLAARLARDLNVGLELVGFRSESLARQLADDHFDFALSGLTDSLERSSAMLMSEPYLVVNMGLLVKDHQRSDFESEELINRRKRLRIGVVKGSYFEKRAADHFPNAQIVRLDSPRQFFDEDWRELDALATHAESGAAWTLVYPAYTVVNPLQRRDGAPVSMAIGGFDVVLDDMLNTWITLLRMDGTLDKLFDHWMLGKNTKPKPPRWSIIRDVLHWVRTGAGAPGQEPV
jgi:Na+/H+-dicarboxylate symporter/ABC-type amino acid transport substrate-binding protein